MASATRPTAAEREAAKCRRCRAKIDPVLAPHQLCRKCHTRKFF